MDYETLRNKIFRSIQERLQEEMDTDDLVAVFKNPEVEFGYMRGITQRMVFNFFPLLAEGKWEIVESKCAFLDSHEAVMHTRGGVVEKPKFYDKEEYLLYKHVYENRKENRSAFEKYNKEYHKNFWADSLLFDGNGTIRFGRNVIISHTSYFHTENISVGEDEVAIILNKKAACSCSKDSDKISGTLFVLRPVAETETERIKVICEYFRSQLIAAYARVLMKHWDDNYILMETGKIVRNGMENLKWS